MGAGAVGGTIGARLHQASLPVMLVARGAHLVAMRDHGLRFVTPDGSRVLRVQTASGPGDVQLSADDVLILTTKSQDTAAALDAWSGAPVVRGSEVIGTAADLLPVLCAQNGVENERLALRRFARVLGVCVWLPAAFTEPGVVVASGAPRPGMLHVGRYPSGAGGSVYDVAVGLRAAGFEVPVRDDVMRWKYGKLLGNIGNAFDALFADRSSWSDLLEAAVREGRNALRAAGIPFTSDREQRTARGNLVTVQDVPGYPRGGGSTWQSLARGAGSVEVDFLNGEVVLLGRIHGVPTPVNAAVQRFATQAIHEGVPPRSGDVAALRALLT